MYRAKLRRIDGELAVIFPNEMMERLGVGEGDTLYLVERDGELILIANDPEARGVHPLDRQREGVREAYEHLAKRYGATLRDLAQ